MTSLVPLTVALPFLAAAALAAFGHFLHPVIDDAVALVAAAGTTGLCVALVVGTADAPIQYAFGGWEPRHGVVLGIEFSVDPLAAAIAALAGLLATASLLASWHYFDEAGHLWSVLVLLFLGGMVGFALSDDIFNLFVWFEVMGVSAFALTAYRKDEPGPLQGALNFAILNSIGALAFLVSIALLYGRTGGLNLAQIGHALTGPPDRLVVVAFVLLLLGFLTKAGAIPFHFWLADAYSVAPVPVCLLLSGVMSDLGLKGIERVYWPIFSETFAGHEVTVRSILVAVGVATMTIGAIMAFLQANLKRMLAFATVSQIGLVLIAGSLLTADGVAGSTLIAVAEGLVRGGLFLCVGVIVTALGDANELRLHGRARHMRVTPLLFLVGVLGLAHLPPFGPFLGVSLVEKGADSLGWSWLSPVIMVSSAIVAAALLRAGARIFLGLGEPGDPALVSLQRPETAGEEEPSEDAGRSRRLTFMAAPASCLLVVAFGLAFAPDLAGHAIQAAERVVDPAQHAVAVLERQPPPPQGPRPSYSPALSSYLYAAGSVLLTLVLAAAGLHRRRVSRATGRVAARVAAAGADRLTALHSGAIGDYVTWQTVGGAILGGLFALTLT